MTATALPTAPARVVTPPARLGLGRLLSINAFWFGNGAHWQPILVALIPEGAKLLVGANASDALVGRATAAGGVFALLVPLIAGWLSDRTRTRWGRRRPWMVAGTAFNVLALALIAFAWTPAALIIFAVALQAANNVAGAAYSGVIPDVVPEDQRGRASGLLGTMNQLGTVIGVLLVAIVLSVFGRSRIGLVVSYGVVATILISTLVITGAYLTWWLFATLHVDPFLSLPVVAAALFVFGYLLQRVLVNRVIRAPLFFTLRISGSRLFIANGSDESATILSLPDLGVLREITIEGEPIRDALPDPRGRYLYLLGRRVHVYDAGGERELHALDVGDPMAIAANGKTLAVVAPEGAVLFDTSTFTETARLKTSGFVRLYRYLPRS